jgi:glycosyltransferase involved in cell wall biosynthesis
VKPKTQNPLVSIIIPTYNRAHLIGETLDSVLAQTYENWECIIVDDGSSDNTDEVVGTYVKKDHRFQYHKRPDTHKPGGNGARNYGFEVSNGEYVQWFDSDDLMVEDFLDLKLKTMLNHDVDFVVTKSINFFEENIVEIKKYNGNSIYPLTSKHLILYDVYWFTLDFLAIKSVLQGLYFDERLKSGQETNFFIRLLTIKNLKGIFVEKVVSKRRIVEDSIQQKLKKDKMKSYQNKLISRLYAYFDIRSYLGKEVNFVMQNQLIELFFKQAQKNLSKMYFYKFNYLIILDRGLFKGFAFLLSIIFHGIPILGYKLLNYVRK